MEPPLIHTLLYAGRWAFVGLVYLVLLLVLVAVRREMALRLGAGQPAASAAVGRLIVLQAGSDHSARPGAAWHLAADNTLGADPANDLTLLDEFVSGRHARLRWDGAGWWLEDLGSKNGTFVNGERIMPLVPHKIVVGSRLQFGDMSFELQE